MILATADLHGNLPEIPECDLLLIAGDICPDFTPLQSSEQKQRHWLDTDFREWLEDIPAKNVVGIAGNHDFVFEHSFLIPKGLRWTYLRDNEVEIDGLRIWGTPWVPNLRFWAFYGSDTMLQARAEGIPTGIDILLTHGPLYGFCDRLTDGSHVGDVAMTNQLERIQPRAIICGHIHEGYGRRQVGHTQILNAALVDVFYDPINPIMKLDLTNPI